VSKIGHCHVGCSQSAFVWPPPLLPDRTRHYAHGSQQLRQDSKPSKSSYRMLRFSYLERDFTVLPTLVRRL
jgi:hypothetical protein